MGGDQQTSVKWKTENWVARVDVLSLRLSSSLKLVRVHPSHRKEKWPAGAPNYRGRKIFPSEMSNAMRRNITLSPAWLWYRVLSYVLLHLPYIFAEIVFFLDLLFYLDLQTELIYNIFLILSRTSLPRKPYILLWPITIIYPSLFSVPVLYDWYPCPYTVYQGHMIMITINVVLTLHKGQDVKAISSLEKRTIDY